MPVNSNTRSDIDTTVETAEESPEEETMTPLENALQRLNPDRLRYDGSRFFFEGYDDSLSDLIILYMDDKGVLTMPPSIDIDFPAIRTLYRVIYTSLIYYARHNPDTLVQGVMERRCGGYNYTIQLPALMEYFHRPDSTGNNFENGVSEEDYRFVYDKIDSFREIMAIMRRGEYEGAMPKIMQFVQHDEESDTITFNSPYIEFLVMSLIREVKSREV